MSEQGSNGEFHRADPAYRRRMQVFLAVTVVLGLLALVALHFWLDSLGARVANGDLFGYERALHRLLGTLCLMLGLTAAGFSVWMFQMCTATRIERRWPPSALRTSADVRIRYLTSADSLVAQLRAGAFALMLLALALIGWGVWLFVSS